jgi:hypothetical protein
MIAGAALKKNRVLPTIITSDEIGIVADSANERIEARSTIERVIAGCSDE